MIIELAEKVREALIGIIKTTGRLTEEAITVIKNTVVNTLQGVHDIGAKSFEIATDAIKGGVKG